jgi:hypothetical protein
MRLNINLASRKYEDVRQFFLRWRAILGLLAAVTLLLGALAALSYSRSIKSGRHIKELEQQIAQLERERQRLIDEENRPVNREVTDQKRFWNAQIARRKFSWTQLLNDLQRIMPARASLVSVQPEMKPDRRLMLELMIEADTRTNARELVERMEASKGFRSTWIKEERVPTTATAAARVGTPGGKFEGVRFLIESEYIPAVTVSPQPPRPRTKEGI